MKRVLLICGAGMSSSMMAKKTTEYFQENGHDIEMTAVGVPEGKKTILSGANYDLYLISPQVRMEFKEMKKAADKMGNRIAQVPPQAYVPIPSGIKNMANLCLDNLDD